ncbi:tyrosine-type recombinase/integrase [Thermodesulfobacteriota bacterium]
MAIIAECPICHSKQSIRNKQCSCGADLDNEKKSKKVKYHIVYRVGGKQKWRSVGSFDGCDAYSIEDARDVESKFRVSKRENKIEIFDPRPDSRMTYEELKNWYLKLKPVKKLASYDRIEIALNNFIKVFGNQIVGSIKPVDLEDYQDTREGQGAAPATIDMEISLVKTMVTKAFDNDMVGGRTVKAFRKVKRKLKKGSNARKRIISIDEYLRLVEKAPDHLKVMIIVDYNTGMRTGELRKLRWSHIDVKEKFIRLPKDITKERKPKIIPINHYVEAVLNELRPKELKVVDEKYHDYVFTYRGKPIVHKNGLKKSLITTCEKAKIPYGRKEPNGIIFHDIRRTVKTNMLEAEVNKVHRDLIVGHSLQGMDVHYLAPSEESLKDAMAKYTEWLDGQFLKASEEKEANEAGGSI